MSWLGLELGLCWGSSAGELCAYQGAARATRPHSASSTVAAAPLVCWRRSSWPLGAGVEASTIRTPKGRSRGGRLFSTYRSSRPNLEAEHATSALQEALVLVVPASHNRLADGVGHDQDDRAGLGLAQSSRWSSSCDVEAPAQASSQYSCMWLARCATAVLPSCDLIRCCVPLLIPHMR